MVTVLTVASVLATGLAGGVFAAFSTFVMGGLRRLDPAAAAAAMNEINRDAVRPPFMTLFAASFLLPATTAVVALVRDDDGGALLVAAAVVAVLGVLAVTAVVNVPLNDRLARSDAPAADWPAYASRWTAWNHARALACALACALAAVALL